MQNPNKTPKAAETTMAGEGCPNRSPEERRAEAVLNAQAPIPTPKTADMRRSNGSTGRQVGGVAGEAMSVIDQGEEALRNFVEKQPYTAAFIALGVGLIVGYAAHREPPPRTWW